MLSSSFVCQDLFIWIMWIIHWIELNSFVKVNISVTSGSISLALTRWFEKCWPFSGFSVLTHLDLVSHICTMKSTSHFPSDTYLQISNIQHTKYQTFKCFLSRLAVVFSQSIEVRYYVEIEDVVGAAPAGDAPTTSEWSTILLPSRVSFIRGFTVYASQNPLYLVASEED